MSTIPTNVSEETSPRKEEETHNENHGERSIAQLAGKVRKTLGKEMKTNGSTKEFLLLQTIRTILIKLAQKEKNIQISERQMEDNCNPVEGIQMPHRFPIQDKFVQLWGEHILEYSKDPETERVTIDNWNMENLERALTKMLKTKQPLVEAVTKSVQGVASSVWKIIRPN